MSRPRVGMVAVVVPVTSEFATRKLLSPITREPAECPLAGCVGWKARCAADPASQGSPKYLGTALRSTEGSSHDSGNRQVRATRISGTRLRRHRS